MFAVPPCLIRTPVPFAAGVSPALPNPIVKCFTLVEHSLSNVFRHENPCRHIGGAVRFANVPKRKGLNFVVVRPFGI
jgi:hypothetical protein